jgi:Na+-driven multidrug efflux pump
LFSALFGISVAAVFLIFRTELLRFFLRAGSTEAMQTGGSFFLIVIPFYLFVSVKIACDGVLRGLGAMRELLTGTFVDLSLRVACGFLFSAIWGSVGIWAAWPVGWVTGTVLSAAFTSSVLRRKNLDPVSAPDTHT